MSLGPLWTEGGYTTGLLGDKGLCCAYDVFVGDWIKRVDLAKDGACEP